LLDNSILSKYHCDEHEIGLLTRGASTVEEMIKTFLALWKDFYAFRLSGRLR
jgi:hypothetical protein